MVEQRVQCLSGRVLDLRLKGHWVETQGGTAGPFPAILGKGPWLELGEKYAAFWEFFRSVDCKNNIYYCATF